MFFCHLEFHQKQFRWNFLRSFECFLCFPLIEHHAHNDNIHMYHINFANSVIQLKQKAVKEKVGQALFRGCSKLWSSMSLRISRNKDSWAGQRLKNLHIFIYFVGAIFYTLSVMENKTTLRDLLSSLHLIYTNRPRLLRMEYNMCNNATPH